MKGVPTVMGGITLEPSTYLHWQFAHYHQFMQPHTQGYSLLVVNYVFFALKGSYRHRHCASVIYILAVAYTCKGST